MTVTHSSLVVLMMTTFSEVKTVKRVAKGILVESEGCVEKTSILQQESTNNTGGKVIFQTG